jgi:hypothetical protein
MRITEWCAGKKEEKDPLMDYLLSFQERMGHAKTLLTDKEKTAFFYGSRAFTQQKEARRQRSRRHNSRPMANRCHPIEDWRRRKQRRCC